MSKRKTVTKLVDNAMSSAPEGEEKIVVVEAVPVPATEGPTSPEVPNAHNKAPELKLTGAQQIEYDKIPSTSDRIRYLRSQNFAKSSIARFLNIRYQHVRNVLITPLKRKSLSFDINGNVQPIIDQN